MRCGSHAHQIPIIFCTQITKGAYWNTAGSYKNTLINIYGTLTSQREPDTPNPIKVDIQKSVILSYNILSILRLQNTFTPLFSTFIIFMFWLVEKHEENFL